MSERAVGFLVSALIHLGLLLTLVVWLGKRTPQLPAPRPVAVTLAMFQRETPAPAMMPPPVAAPRPTPQPVQPEPPPLVTQPPTDQETPVPPDAEPVQQPPPEPRQARVTREPITARQPAKARAVSKSRPEPKPRTKPGPSRATVKTAVKPEKVAVRHPPDTVEPKVPATTDANADHRAPPPPVELAAMESHYLKNVRQRIAEQRFYPPRARRMGHQGTVLLRLVLLPDGSIDNVSLAETSGARILDDAALAAVRRVGRFPPFPEGLARRDWVLTVPIRYSVM